MDVEKIIRKKFKVYLNDVSPTVLLSRIKKENVTRNNLAELIGEIGFKYGAEIGVYTGSFSHKLLSSMVDGRLILVDPWGSYGSCPAERSERRYQRTLERLKNYKDNIIIQRIPSQTAVLKIKDESLDFVYIDALHDFNNGVIDIIQWERKVKSGGIVSGHDYYNGPGFGIIQAVDAYTKCNHIDHFYITREGIPSWFWVKN